MLCGAFTPATPMAAMLGVLLMGGFFRSLQFTALNTLAFADIPHERMSCASSFAAMTQQLSVSLGVGVAAGTLNVSMAVRGGSSLAIAGRRRRLRRHRPAVCSRQSGSGVCRHKPATHCTVPEGLARRAQLT